MHICIAGGGIGGLTLALLLEQRGIACSVYEAANDIRPLGVGINILPHCVAAFRDLDLLPALYRIAVPTRRLVYANQFGQQIWSEPRGLFAGHDTPQFSIHRGRFHNLLWDTALYRLGSSRLHKARRLVSYEQTAHGVRASFGAAEAAQTTIECDALVGADGIHSTVKSLLHPDASDVEWTGIEMWRGAVMWPSFGGGDEMIVAGDAMTKAILYPIAAGTTPHTRLTNWVITQKRSKAGAPLPGREGWNSLADASELSSALTQLKFPWIDLASLVRSTFSIYRFPMCDRNPLPWWSDRRVTLLGDAAHPMYPAGSNGAAQAVLDGIALASHLTQGDVPRAFKLYEEERLPATADIVKSNRVGGPEQVLDLVAQRAPAGFDRIEDVISSTELQRIAGRYATLAGFSATAG